MKKLLLISSAFLSVSCQNHDHHQCANFGEESYIHLSPKMMPEYEHCIENRDFYIIGYSLAKIEGGFMKIHESPLDAAAAENEFSVLIRFEDPEADEIFKNITEGSLIRVGAKVDYLGPRLLRYEDGFSYFVIDDNPKLIEWTEIKL